MSYQEDHPRETETDFDTTQQTMNCINDLTDFHHQLQEKSNHHRHHNIDHITQQILQIKSNEPKN